MSQTIDEKVVEMRFDNSDFESNVKESLSTLDKLKESLNLEDSAKSFSEISKAADKVSFDGMNSGLEAAKERFSILEGAASVALGNITTQAINTGMALAKSFSVDLVSAGWGQYEEKTKAVQTIMNATGLTIAEVDSRLAELIWFADETSYSFSDMTNNVGKFTSMGTDLDSSVQAMMGISNWAAVSGAGIQEASRAMYNLSQAMGVGAVKLMDWKSIQNANMATAEFKEQVIATAKELGTLTAAGADAKGTIVDLTNFDQTLQHEWFTSDVLLKVLQRYAGYTDEVYQIVEDTGVTAAEAMKMLEDMGGEYEDVGKKAFKAAQEAKTYNDAIEATRDAVKSQWADFFENMFGNYEESKKTWTDLANTLYDIFAQPIADINESFSEALDSPTVLLPEWSQIIDELQYGMGMSKEAVQAFEDIVAETARQQGIDIDNLIAKYGSLEAVFVNGFINTDVIKGALDTIESGVIETGKSIDDFGDIVHRVMEGEFGNVDTGRIERLAEAGYDWAEVQGVVDDMILRGMSLEEAMANRGIEVVRTTKEINEELKGIFNNGEIASDKLRDLYDNLSGRDLRNLALSNIIEALGEYTGAINDAFTSIFGTLESGTIRNVLQSVYEWSVKILDEDKIERFRTRLENLFAGVKSVLNVLQGAWSVVKAFIGSSIGPIFQGLFKIVMAIADGIGGLFQKFKDFTGGLTIFSTAVEWINKTFAPFKNAVSVITDSIVRFIGAIFSGKSVLSSFKTAVGVTLRRLLGAEKAVEVYSKFNKVFDSLRSSAGKLWTTLQGTMGNLGSFIREFYNKFKFTEIGQSISKAFESVRNTLSDVWDRITKWFKEKFDFGSIDTDMNFLDTISNALVNFNDKLTNIDIGSLIQNISGGFHNFKESVKNTWSSIGSFFRQNATFNSVVDGVKEKTGELKDAIINNGDGDETPFIERVLNGIKTAVEWFKENAPSLDEILNTITGIFNGAAVAGIITMILKIRNLFIGGKGLQSVITSFSGFMKGLKAALYGFAFDKMSSGLIKVAGAFAIVAASLIALTFVDSGRLESVAIIMGALATAFAAVGAAIALIMNAISKKRVADKMADLSKITDSISEAIGSVSAGIQTISGGFSGALQALAGGFTGAMQTVADGVKSYLKIKAWSGAILSIAASIAILVGSIWLISKLDDETVRRGVMVIGIMMAGMTMFMSLTRNLSAQSGIAVLLIANTILAFVGIIALINLYSPEQLVKGLAAIGAMLAEITFFLRYSESLSAGTGVSILAISALLTAFVRSVSKLSKFNFTQILSALVALGSIVMMLVFYQSYAEPLGKGGSSGLIAMALSFILFASALSVLAKLQPVALLSAVMALGAVIIEIYGLIYILNSVELDTSKLKMLPLIGLALLGFAASVTLLAGVPWKAIAVGMVSLIGIMGTLVVGAKILSSISADLKPISIFLATAAGSILAIAAAIFIVTEAINNMNLDNVQNVLSTLIVGLVKDLVNAIVESASTIIEGIITMISTLAAQAPQLVDALITLVKNVLDALTQRMPEFAESIASFCKALIQSFADAFEGVDITPILIAIGSIFGSVIAFTAIGKFGSLGALTKGIVMFAEVIAAVGLIVAAFGALNKIDGFAEFMAGGAEIMGIIGGAIGAFVGNIVGGAIEGVTSHLPQSAEYLSQFMENISGFIEGASGIDDSFSEAVSRLTLAMLELTGASFIDSILDFGAKLFGGGTSDYMSKFVTFGESLSAFAFAIKDIDVATVNAATNAGQMIAALSVVMPGEGGLLSWIIGEKDFSSAKSSFGALGEGISAFINGIEGATFDESSSEMVKNAAASIASLMAVTPGTGGLLQWIVGESTVSASEENFRSLGLGVSAFAEAIQGTTFDESTATTVQYASEAITSLMKATPNEGGLWQWIVGESGIANSEENFAALGRGINAFVGAIDSAEFKSDMSDTVMNAANAVSALMSVVPNEGGLWQWIAGESSLSKSEENFAALGRGINAFVQQIDGQEFSGNVNDTIMKAVDAIAALMAVTPGDGGLVEWITGKNNFNDFALGMAALGVGLKYFVDQTKGIAADDVTNAKLAVDELVSLMDNMPANDGEMKRMAEFGNNISLFGDSLSNFMSSLTGVDATKVESAHGIIDGLVSMMNSTAENGVPTDMSSMSTFADSFIGSFSQAFSNSADSANFGETIMSSITDSLSNNSDLTSAGEANVDAFIQGMENKEADVTSKASTMASDIADSMNKYTAFMLAAVNNMLGFYMGLIAYNSTIRGQASNIVNGVLTALDAYADFRRLGMYNMQGYELGLKDYAPRVIQTARDIAGQVVKNMNEETGTESPSKELIKLGMYNDMGYAHGLAQYAYLVTNAAESVADGAMDSIRGSLNGLNFDDIDDTPVVRPVLDLSEIQNGARGIGSILNAENGIQLDTINASRIAGQISRRDTYAEAPSIYDDANVIESIKSLGDRVDGLGTAISKMGISIDRKKLVGEIITDVDKGLGSISRRQMRGVN